MSQAHMREEVRKEVEAEVIHEGLCQSSPSKLPVFFVVSFYCELSFLYKKRSGFGVGDNL